MRRFLENTDVSKDLDPWLKSIQSTLDGAFIDDLEEFLIQYEQWLGELGAHRSHGFRSSELGSIHRRSLQLCA